MQHQGHRPRRQCPSLGNNLELSRDQEDGAGVAALPRAPPGGQTWGVPRFPLRRALRAGVMIQKPSGPGTVPDPIPSFPFLFLWCEKMP